MKPVHWECDPECAKCGGTGIAGDSESLAEALVQRGLRTLCRCVVARDEPTGSELRLLASPLYSQRQRIARMERDYAIRLADTEDKLAAAQARIEELEKRR